MREAAAKAVEAAAEARFEKDWWKMVEAEVVAGRADDWLAEWRNQVAWQMGLEGVVEGKAARQRLGWTAEEWWQFAAGLERRKERKRQGNPEGWGGPKLQVKVDRDLGWNGMAEMEKWHGRSGMEAWLRGGVAEAERERMQFLRWKDLRWKEVEVERSERADRLEGWHGQWWYGGSGGWWWGGEWTWCARTWQWRSGEWKCYEDQGGKDGRWLMRRS